MNADALPLEKNFCHRDAQKCMKYHFYQQLAVAILAQVFSQRSSAFTQQNHSDDDPPGLFILGMLLPRCLSRNRNDKMNVILCASFRQSVMQQIEKLPERKRAGREAGRGFRRAARTTPPRRFLSSSTLSGSLCCMASHTS